MPGGRAPALSHSVGPAFAHPGRMPSTCRGPMLFRPLTPKIAVRQISIFSPPTTPRVSWPNRRDWELCRETQTRKRALALRAPFPLLVSLIEDGRRIARCLRCDALVPRAHLGKAMMALRESRAEPRQRRERSRVEKAVTRASRRRKQAS